MRKVLMIDIGGTNVKLMASDVVEVRKIPSGPRMTARQMVARVLKATTDWRYDVISIGFPGHLRAGWPSRNPLNLGGGWVSFDYEKAFGKPVRMIHDAALQALASYEGGRMLFVGFGTSIGTSLVVDDVVVPVEFGLMRLRRQRALTDCVTKKALQRLGQKRWQSYALEAITLLQDMFWPTDTVIGGGNAKHLEPLPKGCRRRNNQDAFRGALRLWPGADMLAEPRETTWHIRPHRRRESSK